MVRNLKIDNKLRFVADFETTSRNGKEVVWLYDICKMSNYSHYTGESLEEFMNFVDYIGQGCDIYFHNLKFDASFIINFLLENGYTINQNDNLKMLKRNELSTLITDLGQFFKVTIKNKRGKFVNFIDSLKVIPFSAEKIAKDFQLSIAKGSIDYDKPRPNGYKATQKEIEYCCTDTQIIAEAMNHMLQLGHDKLTLSANAYEDYKHLISKGDWDNWYGEWETNCDLELDKEIRKAYRGGFCFANPKYVNKTIKRPTYYYDVNSLYPYVMSKFNLPYGSPIPFSGKYEKDNDAPYYIQKVKIDMRVKPNGVPCILNQCKMDSNTRYIIDSVEQGFTGGTYELTVTNFDLELIFKNYKIYHIEYLGGWKFKVRKDMFTKYVKKYYEMKKEADRTQNRVKRTIAKLFLNSLYGKFGQNPKRAKKYPKLGKDGKVRLKYDVECDENEPLYHISKKFNYLPVAVFITSIARWLIIKQILEIGIENWVYSDTDSIISLVKLPFDMIHKEKLGKFKTEHIMKKFKTLGQKTYYGIDINGEKVVAVAGCSKKALKDLPFGKFEYYDKKSQRRKGVIRNGRTCLTTCVGGKKVSFGDFCLRDKRDMELIKIMLDAEEEIEEIEEIYMFDKYLNLDIDNYTDL